MALGPNAGPEHERKPDPREDNSARARNYAHERRKDQQQDADCEQRPFDDRVIDQPPPLWIRAHVC